MNDQHDWAVDWCVDRCTVCGAPADVPCRVDCDEKDFRDAKFAESTDPPEWPTDEERYK
jgi:hypothetical protein